MTEGQKQKSTYYRWCIVPECNNTSIKTPKKTFIQVPNDEKRRRQWYAAVRRDFTPRLCKRNRHNVFVCEDHFDLENDMENYVRWKLMGGLKRMKKNAVPHKFDWQRDRKRAFSISSVPRSAAVKREKMGLVEEALSRKTTDIVAAETTMVTVSSTHTEETYDDEGTYDEVATVACREVVERKHVAVTAKPHFRSKYTQTTSQVICQSCSQVRMFLPHR